MKFYKNHENLEFLSFLWNFYKNHDKTINDIINDFATQYQNNPATIIINNENGKICINSNYKEDDESLMKTFGTFYNKTILSQYCLYVKMAMKLT